MRAYLARAGFTRKEADNFASANPHLPAWLTPRMVMTVVAEPPAASRNASDGHCSSTSPDRSSIVHRAKSRRVGWSRFGTVPSGGATSAIAPMSRPAALLRAASSATTAPQE